MMLSDIGEKALIAQYIRPLFNPLKSPEGVGDDCALIPTGDDDFRVCISTDRVPANLTAFKLRLIGYRQLGYYLAVLNISDIAAAGGKPSALLLNLAFPAAFRLDDLLALLEGVKDAADRYGAPVLGGDLSDAAEPSLVAISVGLVRRPDALLRSGARPGDLLFCSDSIGVCPAAFLHFLNAVPTLPLTEQEHATLTRHFTNPTPRVELGQRLGRSGACTAAMDVTDGVGQSFAELASASGVAMVLECDRIPIDPICAKVAKHYGREALDVALAAGADFQLVGAVNPNRPGYADLLPFIHLIGRVEEGSGLFRAGSDGRPAPYTPSGWNYYARD